MPKPETTEAAITDLVPDKKNPRRRTARNRGVLRGSLQELGAARSIVIDENNEVMAGNGVTEAAKAIGMKKVRIIDADGSELIAVRRSNLTPEQKARLKLFDNQAGLLSEWDVPNIKDMRDEGISFDGIFTSDEVETFTAEPEPIEKITITRPPKMVWVLVGIPLDRFADAQAALVELERVGEISVQTSRDK